MDLLDFRSDTVTKPSAQMLQAMLDAPVGDDVYGEDPSVLKLEQRAAALLGMESAVFMPTGTMANQVALNLHTRPGDGVLAEESCHISQFEAGAAAALSGLQFQFVPLAKRMHPEALEFAYEADSLHGASTTLLALENTHNLGAGRVLTEDEMGRACQWAHVKGLKVHCDGARLWHAALATGQTEAALVAGCDTVSVCLSKGLGAPMGSLLCGTQGDMKRARKIRKRFGGGMRQAGFMAACGLFGIEHQRSRLRQDHEGAAYFAQSYSSQLEVDYPEPGTNIVCFQAGQLEPNQWLHRLKDHGILLNHLGKGRLRLVWHLDIPRHGTERLVEAFKKILADS